MSGPKLFLQRLMDTGDLDGYEIVNPNRYTQDSINAARSQGKKVIGRLDGAYYYKFTLRNFYNFLLQRSRVLSSNFVLDGSNFDQEFPLLTNAHNNYLNKPSKYILDNADGVVFQSKLSLEMHKKFVIGNIDSVKHCIINNGVDLNIFSPKPINRLDGSPALIISASNYRLNKRLVDAIRIVNRLSKKYPNIVLHILGDINPIVRSSISDIDSSHCRYHGRVSPNLLPLYYSAVDIMLSTSIFDPCPNVVVEAMACGLPVLTPLESGASELVSLDDLIVKEDVPLGYYEMQTPGQIPNAPISEYVACVEMVLDSISLYRDKVRHIACKNFDIRSIYKRYLDFCLTI